MMKKNNLLYLFFININTSVNSSVGLSDGYNEYKDKVIIFEKEKLNKIWKNNHLLMLVKLISVWTIKLVATNFDVLTFNWERLLFFYFNNGIYSKELFLKWGLIQEFNQNFFLLMCTLFMFKRYLYLIWFLKKWI